MKTRTEGGAVTQEIAFKQLYEGILASIPASVLLLDRRLRVVSANRNFLDKSLRSQDATLGQELAQVFPPVLLTYTHLEDRIRKVFDTGQAEDGGEMTYRAPGVPTRVYFYRLTPVYDKGGRRVEHVMLLMEDRTDRVRLGEEIRRVEQHLASVVESANDIVVSMNVDGAIQSWNRAAEVISGFGWEHVRGRPLIELCAPENRDSVRTSLLRMRGGQRTSANIEADLITNTGNRVPVAWSLSSMRDDSNWVIGLVAIGRDLSERRQMEAQLIQSAKMVSLGIMAGGIAHEIRNPLAICSAAAQLLHEYPDDSPLIHEATAKIRVAVRRASEIIENLLKFARPSEDRMASLDLNEVVYETLRLIGNETSLRLIKVQENLTNDLPTVLGNRSLLQQVFTNLILNGSNAMPGGGELCVTTRAQEQGVQVIFGDTGHGIIPQHLDHIFDPFFTTMPVGQGVGLGLSISYAIAKQHGGRITAESQVGKGSTFTVWLPAAGEETRDK